jgi:hypothetical protein
MTARCIREIDGFYMGWQEVWGKVANFALRVYVQMEMLSVDKLGW